MAVLVGKKAPSFKAKAVVMGGEIVNDFSLWFDQRIFVVCAVIVFENITRDSTKMKTR